MPISPLDYEAMKARLRKSQPVTEAIDERRLAADAVKEEHILDGQIRKHCQNRVWIAIKSRTDIPTGRIEGEWDWHILADGGRAFYIECKKRGEKLDTDQQALHYWASTLGHKVHTVWKFEEFLEIVK